MLATSLPLTIPMYVHPGVIPEWASLLTPRGYPIAQLVQGILCIQHLGPRTQQLACFAPGTQTATWDITEQGAYVRSQKPAFSTVMTNIDQNQKYTLSFETKIDYGGVGWRVETEIDVIQASGP